MVKNKSRIKRLYASLLCSGIVEYLITRRFDNGCLESDVDELWEKCESYVRNLSEVAILIPGHTGYARDALGHFLSALFVDQNDFTVVDLRFMDFVNWLKKEINKARYLIDF